MIVRECMIVDSAGICTSWQDKYEIPGGWLSSGLMAIDTDLIAVIFGGGMTMYITGVGIGMCSDLQSSEPQPAIIAFLSPD